ncbi:hypothetical protein [Asticcacaulis sp.]|uniref:hypothetical protein n=1 Tax=Asticcacaulis sp. TaxID=1872648 RepID=UPI002613F182|nr:hypothetical protein [Asticcacaulis sp.]
MKDLQAGLPGYSFSEISEGSASDAETTRSREDWAHEFATTRKSLCRFFQVRDPYMVAARTAAGIYLDAQHSQRGPETLQQAHVEIIQCLLLLCDETRHVPASPGNMMRLWPLVDKHMHAFLKQQPDKAGVSPIERFVIRQTQVGTMFYRNLFKHEDCIETMQALFGRIDGPSEKVLGYRLSDLFRACVRISEIIGENLSFYWSKVYRLLEAKDKAGASEAIDFFRACYPLADRAWRDRTDKFRTLKDLKDAGFQVSELAYPWAFTITQDELNTSFSPEIVAALYQLAIRPGELKGENPDHIYLNNPVWRQPYVRTADDNLFAPLPSLIFSFPFLILEQFVKGHASLEKSYEQARSKYLEDAVFDLLATAMPSASIHRNVTWTDTDDGKIWENDIVAVVGNFLFVFEAKSGHIKDAARRGGLKSLQKNINELFIEPARQADRLQKYLDTSGAKAQLRDKVTGKLIDLQLDRPKVVFNYSICLEHFTVLTSTKAYLRDLGFVGDDSPWTPALTLGELQMIVRFLDSEVSFVHYLSRRATLEQVLDFHGDEQDVLSAYLNNGFWINPEVLDGRKVIFQDSDGAVRQPKTPRQDRSVVEINELYPPLWREIIVNLYRDKSQRHRFDIINTLLNQPPQSLRELERRIRRFRRGEPTPKDDVIFSKFNVGKKEFVVAIHLLPQMRDPSEFHVWGRNFTRWLSPEGGAVECVSFQFVRRPKLSSFAQASFYRYVVRPQSHESDTSLDFDGVSQV